MRGLLGFAALVSLCACSVPGQHMAQRSWVYEQPEASQRDYTLIRISPATLAQMPAADGVTHKSNPELAAAIRGYEYRVGPKDILTFTVWDHPELTIPAGEFRAPEIQGHLVSPQGDIFFPYVGKLTVAGQTLAEIRDSVSQRLARYIQNPQLDVRVASFRSKRISVTGQVSKPGSFPLTDVPVTLIEAVNLAGGAAPEAALQEVRVTRGDQTQVFDVRALLEHGDLGQNTLLADGDLVYVPDNSFYAVHVLGSVSKPGIVPMSGGRLNLAEVISVSEGFDRMSADPGRIFVFRNDGGTPSVYWLDASSPDAMLLATQFRMKPQDVTFVAATGLARWNRVVSLILPTIQTLWQTQSFIDRVND